MRRISFGLLLIALTSLMVELSLVRVFDVIWHSNMAYMIITMVMFCFGLSGVFLSLWPVENGPRLRRTLCLLSVVYALSLALLLPALNNIPIDFHSFHDHPATTVAWFMLMYFCISLPFFVAGCILTVIFSGYANSIQKLYFWDLVGAAAGCVILIPFLPIIGPGGLMLAGAGMVFFAAALFLEKSFAAKALVVIGCAFLLLPFGRYFLADSSLDQYFEFKHHIGKRGVMAAIKKGKREVVNWDPISKIDIIDKGHSKHVAYDGGTQSSFIYPFSGDYEALRESLPKSTPKNFGGQNVYVSHYIKEGTHPNVLVIGSAAGQETKAALTFGASHVDAVELVGFVIHAGKELYNEYNGNIFNHPNVTTHVAEGRSFLRSSEKTYDIIQIYSNHTSSSIAAGSGAMATTYLQTTDAYKEYFSHLSEDGILHINHHIYPRMVTTAAKAWKEMGKDDFRKHVLVFSVKNVQDNLPTMLIKMSPWTEEEVAHLKTWFWGSVEMVENPYAPEESMLTDEFYSGGLSKETIATVPYRIVAPTDDRPYFNFLRKEWKHYKRAYPEVFMDYGTAALLSSQYVTRSRVTHQNEKRLVPTDIAHLFVTSGASLFFAAIFIFVPLLFARAGRVNWPGKAASLSYFACLGSGFIILELVYIQMFMKLIGFPLYTYSTVVFALLVAAGSGSYLSGIVGITPQKRWYLPFAGVLLTTVTFLLVHNQYFTFFLTYPTLVRILAAIMLLFPLGFFLGMCFPLGILSVHRQPAGVVAWAWGMNGLFTVIGGILSVLLSIYLGFTATLAVGIAIYCFAFLLFSRIRRNISA